MTTDEALYDVVIIGGGTAGLFSAYYAGMRELKTKIIDFLPELGGTVIRFYPDKDIYDIGGIPKISGRDFVAQAKEQGLLFDPDVVLNQAIEQLNPQDDGTFELIGDQGERHYARKVVIAAGPGVIRRKGETDQYKFDVEPLKRWGFTLEKRRIPVNEHMQTPRDGVYAAGDIAGYPKKWRLIASAYTESITAINHIKCTLDPSASGQVYSSILYDND